MTMLKTLTEGYNNQDMFRVAILAGILASSFAFGASGKVQQAFGLGPVVYSGKDTARTFSPLYAFSLSYSANKKLSKFFWWFNRFDFGFFMGESFTGGGSYYGLNGAYNFGPRLNFAKDGMVPYIDAGPLLGFFAVTQSSASGTSTKNQTALKYGYSLGTGFDSIGDENSGGGGWGIAVSYFKYLPSGSLDFPQSSISATGVKIEFRFISKSTK